MKKLLKIISVLILTTLAGWFNTGCSWQPASGSERGSNVIIIVIDTLRADHLGCYGYFRDTSPGIDDFSRECVLFKNAFCSVPITFPSHTSILTGLYPQQSGVVRNRGHLDENITTLAEIMKEQGYRTGAVVSTAVLKKEKNLSQGFQDYLHNWGISDLVPPGSGEVWEIKGIAQDANRLALDWLGETPKEPFFLFMNYYDVHAPYIDHKEVASCFTTDTDQLLKFMEKTYDQVPKAAWKLESINRYDRALRYLDGHLNDLLQTLRKRGLLENTIVIITSDHGNGLYQHLDYWGHGQNLYDEQIHIPLLVRLPQGYSEKIKGQVETVDIFNTVLDLLGIELPGMVDGESFLNLISKKDHPGKKVVFAMRVLEDSRGDPNPNQFAVRSREEKLIHTIKGQDGYFDLSSDPFELVDLEQHQTNLPPSKHLKSLRNQGLNWYQLKRIQRNRPGPMDAQTMKELKALGYITQ